MRDIWEKWVVWVEKSNTWGSCHRLVSRDLARRQSPCPDPERSMSSGRRLFVAALWRWAQWGEESPIEACAVEAYESRRLRADSLPVVAQAPRPIRVLASEAEWRSASWSRRRASRLHAGCSQTHQTALQARQSHAKPSRSSAAPRKRTSRRSAAAAAAGASMRRPSRLPARRSWRGRSLLQSQAPRRSTRAAARARSSAACRGVEDAGGCRR